MSKQLNNDKSEENSMNSKPDQGAFLLLPSENKVAPTLPQLALILRPASCTLRCISWKDQGSALLKKKRTLRSITNKQVLTMTMHQKVNLFLHWLIMFFINLFYVEKCYICQNWHIKEVTEMLSKPFPSWGIRTQHLQMHHKVYK